MSLPWAPLPILLCASLTALTPATASPALQHSSESTTEQPKSEARLPRPATFVTDIARSEELSSAATADLRSTWLSALQTDRAALLLSSFAADYRGHFPLTAEFSEVPADSFELSLFQGLGAGMQDAQGTTAALLAQVADWTHVERSGFKFFHFLAEPSAEKAFAAAHFSIGGPRVGGGRGWLEAELELLLVLKDGHWRIQRLVVVGAKRSATRRAPFRDISDSTGFHFNQSAENLQLNQTFVNERRMLTVGGVNTIDWNRDGFWDVLATRRGQLSVLFQNDGQGGFERIELPFPVPQESAYTYLFLDLDGDFREELVVGQVLDYGGGLAHLPIYTRPAGKNEWVRSEKALSFQCPPAVRGHSVQGIDAADIDGDGLLDLYFAMHSDSRSGGAKFNQYMAFDGGRNLLFTNEGQLSFREVAEERGLHGQQYTFLARFFDFDGDGDTDLFEGNDFGPNWLWRNNGSGHFVRADDHPLSGASAYTMGFSIADLEGSGEWSYSLSNMYSHAGNRIVPLAEKLSLEMRLNVLASGMGNLLFTQQSDGEFQERGHELAISEAGWAWASVFLDVDADGDQDLYVVNGNTSNEDETAPDW